MAEKSVRRLIRDLNIVRELMCLNKEYIDKHLHCIVEFRMSHASEKIRVKPKERGEIIKP